MAQEPLKDLQATAMDSYFDFLHKTISSCPTGGTQLGEKLKDCSEKNIAAARDCMRKLSQAKDFAEVPRIQPDFMHPQLSAFGEKEKGLGEAYTKAAADAVKKPLKKVA